jgi:hypothetical protein
MFESETEKHFTITLTYRTEYCESLETIKMDIVARRKSRDVADTRTYYLDLVFSNNDDDGDIPAFGLKTNADRYLQE